MNRKVLLIAALILSGLVALGIFLSVGNQSSSHQTHAVKDVYYCPMHKDYVSDKPGNCPICSMKLVKKEVQESPKSPGMNAPAETMPQETTGVFISPERQQMLGVRSVPAQKKEISLSIRTVGRIAFDETRIAHVHTKFSGWIEQVFVDFVGETVRKGQPLFTIYSPELVSTQEEYLVALRSKEQLGDSSFEWISKSSNSLADSARERLRLWGISDAEIEEIARTGKAKRTLTIYSQANGIVIQRAAYHHGTYITPENEIYTIVDISNVWLLADIYEKDLPFIKTGEKVTIDFPYESGTRTIESKIQFFYPYLDPTTRTGQVRLQLSNAGYQLKPDQYVNVTIETGKQQQLVVPSDAVLNTGEKQYVFVDLGSGYFDPREVQVGIQTPDGTAIEEGLKEGERVVTAANFLLDSEARLKGALENMGKPKKSMSVQSEPAASVSIKILEPKTAKSGDNDFKVLVEDASGKPVAGAEVEITLSMSAMGNMPPMSSKATLLDRGNGIYAGSVNVAVPSTWETMIVVQKEGKLLGTMKTSVTAR